MKERQDDGFCLIVMGGTVDLQLLTTVYEGTFGYPKHPYVIGVDRGLDALLQAGITPDYAVGDFDSASGKLRAQYVSPAGGQLQERCLLLKPEKDLTDTHAAVLFAKESGLKRLLFLGATGTRLDHTLGNLSLLYTCRELGLEAQLLDPHNRVSLVTREKTIRADELYGDYLSLLPCGMSASHITLTGFKYNVQDLSIAFGETIGISNEITEKESHITVGDGCLYVMETRD